MSKANPERDMAQKIAELQSFMSPLFVWKMIWEEVIPREYDKDEKVYKDTYGVLASEHGFVNLLALWYICSELYQGIAPAKIIIQEQLRIAPGLGRKGKPVSIVTLNTMLSRFVLPLPGETRRKSRKCCLGWFVETRGQELLKKYPPIQDGDEEKITYRNEVKNSQRYIDYTDDVVKYNIHAIVKTALDVGKVVRGKEFVENQIRDMTKGSTMSSEQEIHNFLNKTGGTSSKDASSEVRERSLRERYGDEVLKFLKKHGFRDQNKIEEINECRKSKGKDPVIAKFACLRGETDPLNNFRNYNLTVTYPPTIKINPSAKT